MSRFVGRTAALIPVLAAAISMSACASHSDDSEEGDEGALTMGTAAWNDAAEAEWSAFIARIGEARAAGKCTTVNKCISDPAINPYKQPNDPPLDIFADCADLPMELRAYFAMKTNRPFRYVSDVIGDQPTEPGRAADWRYSANNHPTAFATVRISNSMQALMTRIANNVHSGFFRLSPDVQDGDTYPVDVRPGTVRPGTVFYDPNGHVLVVYRVEDDGTVRMIDGHPDNSLTHTILDDRLTVGIRAKGGGFRNFRPVVPNGSDWAFAPNSQLKDLGDSQYGRGAAYYEWVRTQLSGGKALNPETQLTRIVDQLCTDVKTRVDAVAPGVHLSTQPLADFPDNIYGADGDWEAFSTPGRDQRLRASFRVAFKFVQDSVNKVNARDASIAWNGTAKTLAAKYKDVWSQRANACRITYTNSAGAPVTLTLGDIQKRLYKLSFDPYHCAEMRWGAYPDASNEARSCNTLDAEHVARFDGEQGMRNIIERPPAGTPTPLGYGPAQGEDVDIGRLIDSLMR